ncbi:unnamed protein product [Heterobilharzia americana]|nr:unnamed protein product [Heterobilharzia americana]CAH8513501.1 unnamed protein product [Heterobilharzia americana]
MNIQCCILIFITITAMNSISTSNVIQECEKVNNENVVNVSSKHSSLVETFKTSTTITCSFCMIAVNLAKKFITKPSVFQLIHGIVTEMCSVVEGYKMEKLTGLVV